MSLCSLLRRELFRHAVPLIALLSWLAPPALAQETRDRLDPAGDPAAQLTAYAAALGIEADDVTEAIFDGRFVPALSDLHLVMRALWDSTCARDFAQLLNDPFVTPGQVQNYDCLVRATQDTGSGAAAWQARFGPAPREELFLLATRLSYMLTREEGPWTDAAPETGMKSPAAQTVMQRLEAHAAPYYFLWNDASNPRSDFAGRYARMRRAYLAELSARLPEDARAALGLVGDGRAIDVLDRVCADGACDPGVLKVYATGDARRIRMHALAGTARMGDRNWTKSGRVPQVPYLSNLSAWGLTRIAEIGPCGDPTVGMVHSSTAFTDWYRGGLFEQRIEQGTTRTAFTALAAFSDVMIAAPLDIGIEFEAYRALARKMGCDNPMRAGFEANMVAFFRGESMPYRSGF